MTIPIAASSSAQIYGAWFVASQLLGLARQYLSEVCHGSPFQISRRTDVPYDGRIGLAARRGRTASRTSRRANRGRRSEDLRAPRL